MLNYYISIFYSANKIEFLLTIIFFHIKKNIYIVKENYKKYKKQI